MRQLGRDGPEVGVVGLGCNNVGRSVDLEGTQAIVDAALDEGITLLDTADIYGGQGGSEALLGKALGARRERVVLATKFGHAMPGGPEVPLRRLRTDRIDLYQYHRPDGVTPMAETIGAMAELVRQGSVRYLGVSNVAPREVDDAVSAAQLEGVPLVSVQNEYSLHRRDAEDELLPLCERLGLGVLPYFPLASGFLTGKYRRGQPAPPGSRLEGRPERLTDDAFERLEALERYAEARGLALLQVAIGGLAAQPAVASVIAGATEPGQVRANVRAAAWEPTEEDLRELTALR